MSDPKRLEQLEERLAERLAQLEERLAQFEERLERKVPEIYAKATDPMSVSARLDRLIAKLAADRGMRDLEDI
jgi:hypothetical protein